MASPLSKIRPKTADGGLNKSVETVKKDLGSFGLHIKNAEECRDEVSVALNEARVHDNDHSEESPTVNSKDLETDQSYGGWLKPSSKNSNLDNGLENDSRALSARQESEAVDNLIAKFKGREDLSESEVMRILFQLKEMGFSNEGIRYFSNCFYKEFPSQKSCLPSYYVDDFLKKERA